MHLLGYPYAAYGGLPPRPEAEAFQVWPHSAAIHDGILSVLHLSKPAADAFARTQRALVAARGDSICADVRPEQTYAPGKRTPTPTGLYEVVMWYGPHWVYLARPTPLRVENGRFDCTHGWVYTGTAEVWSGDFQVLAYRPGEYLLELRHANCDHATAWIPVAAVADLVDTLDRRALRHDRQPILLPDRPRPVQTSRRASRPASAWASL